MKKKLIIATAATAALFLFAAAFPSWAEVAPAKADPKTPGSADNLTIQECLGIAAGLNVLDTGYRRIVAEGKPTESAETIRFKLTPGALDAIGHNQFVLGQVQQEGQAANRRAQLQIMDARADKADQSPIKPGTKENMLFDERMSDYTAKPCRVELDHFRDADLKTDPNIPGAVRSLLWKIIDRDK